MSNIIIKPAAVNEEYTEQELRQIEKLFGNPRVLPSGFKDWLVDYIALNQPLIPVSQIFGFSQFTVQVATTVTTQETTTSVTTTDLATVGPTLSSLPDGQYIVAFGFVGYATVGADAEMSVEQNGVAVPGFCLGRSQHTSPMRIVSTPLDNNGVNEIEAKYRVASAAGTATFGERWMIALRYANL